MTPEHLRDLLEYQRKVLELFLTVSSIFGGFAITGMVALRSEERRDRAHSLAFFSLAVAASAFILSTALDSIWLPVSQLQRLNTVPALQTVLSVGDVITWTVIVGASSLIVAVGSFGFARSRRMGIAVLLLAIAATVIFVISVLELASVT